MAHHLHREQRVRASLEEVWTFFSDPRNLDTLTPPDLAFRIIGDPAAGMYPGQMIEYRIRFVKGLWSKWLTEITHVEEPHFFIDEQRIGPYKLWHHEHRFIQQGEEILLVDHVTYVVGFGLIGDLLARLWINRKLAWIFDFRQRKTTGLFGSSRLAD
ncbi:MAG TPA: SRPBCC family protein [bacterium]|nr:SRPBCC family protein [bacterium]